DRLRAGDAGPDRDVREAAERRAGGRDRVIAGRVGERQRLGLDAGGDGDRAEGGAGEVDGRRRRVRHRGRSPVGRRIPVEAAAAVPRLAAGRGGEGSDQGGEGEEGVRGAHGRVSAGVDGTASVAGGPILTARSAGG